MEASLKRKILSQFDDEARDDQVNRGVEARGIVASAYKSSYENYGDRKKVKLEVDGNIDSYFDKKESIDFGDSDSDADSEDIDLGDSDTDTSEDIKYDDNKQDPAKIIKSESENELPSMPEKMDWYEDEDIESELGVSELEPQVKGEESEINKIESEIDNLIHNPEDDQLFTLKDFKAKNQMGELDFTSIDEDIDGEEVYDEDLDEKPEWVEDDTVPRGWKRRILPDNVSLKFNIPCILSPCGRRFKTRHLALKWLIKDQAYYTDIEEMEQKLVHEGFKTNSLLPQGWKFRCNNFHKFQFLNEDCKLFTTLKDATDAVNKNYSLEDSDRFKMFVEITSIEKRMENYSWEESCTVPAGWKVRVAEGKSAKTFYLSPDGHQFASRCLGLQHMIKTNFKSEDIQAMMNKMVEYEDWDFNEKLPEGWMIRLTSSSRNLLFLTREGVVLESFSTALEYLKSPSYSAEDVEKMEQVMTSIGVERRLDGYNWEEDDDLPPGWKIRYLVGNEKKVFILSPDGTQFVCRRNALKYMVDNGFPEDDVEIMRKDLRKDGWEDDRLLPKGWKYRIYRITGRDVYFLDEKGQRYHGFKAVKHYFESNPEVFSKKDISNFEIFCEVESVRRKTTNYQWNKEDETIPEGWMSRVVPGAKSTMLFLSPDGIQFNTRRVAFQHLVKNGQDEEEIGKMRNCLQHEGWEFNADLPNLWMYWQAAKSYSGSSRSIKILTDEGQIFESFLTATDFLSSSEKYGKDDVEKIKKFMKEKSAERRQESDLWKSEKILPTGWKSRYINGFKHQRKIFLSPEGAQFASERVAFQHMVENNYAPSEIQKMQNCMTKEGWEYNKYLPKGWMIRTITQGTSKNMILSSEGKSFHSYVMAVEYMKSNEKYTSKDIELIQEVINEKLMERTENNEDWFEDRNLPQGWKIRITGATRKQFFLAPDGLQFPSRRAALQHMIQENYGDKEVDQMKTCLILFEGYEANEFLPKGWLVTSSRGAKHKIITDDGKTFPSYVSAAEFMKSNKKYTEEDIRLMQKVMDDMGKKRNENNECWVEDKSLPAGWKIRVADGKIGKQFYLSPSGVQFPCRRAALQHMIQEKYAAQQIQEMRSSLLLDGWEFNTNLPTNWLYRGSAWNKGGLQCQILSECGRLFESFHSAVEYLKSSPDHNTRHVKNMQNCLKEKSNIRRRSQENWLEDKYVPAGWMSRVIEGKVQRRVFMSSDGTQFSCGRSALQHMIHAKYPKPQINKMRISLLREKWEFNQNLPKLWMYRESSWKSKKGISKNVQILSEDGQLFESFLAAMEFVKSDPQFTKEDFEKFQNCMTEKANNRRQSLELWKEDKNLPSGWKFRIVDGKNIKRIFLDPSGSQFTCGKTALLHMIKKEYEESEINKMRKMMLREGWEQDVKLPQGWLIKETSSKSNSGISANCKIITDDGTVFESFSSVIEEMLSGKRFGAADVEKIKEIMAERSTIRRQTMVNWEDDKNLPAGWKCRIAEGVRGVMYYLAPDGKQFQTRRASYQHLINENYDAKDVEVMRKLLISHEKWQHHSKLPSGWIFKETSADCKEKAKMRTLYGYNFLTTEGHYFEGSTKAIEYMKSSSLYSESNLQQFSEFIPERQAMRRKTLDDWEDDKNLPSGWRFKISGNTDVNAGKVYYLSPDGKQIQGRRLVYMHLIKEKYDSADIDIMKNLLITFEQWQENPNLPLGWIFRKASATATEKRKNRVLYGFHFISSEGDYFEGNTHTMDYIKDSPLYSDIDLDKFTEFISEMQALRRKSMDDWEDDKNLPTGWRFKISGSTENTPGKLYYLSPDGKQIQGRKSCLLHLIKSNHSEDDIDKMKDMMIKYEKWERNTNLPHGWIFREGYAYGLDRGVERTLHNYSFISTEGEYFDSFVKAAEFIKNNQNYSEVDAEKITKLIPEKQAARRVNTDDWLEDDSLPEGWKLKAGEGKKRYFLSPDGVSYQNRRSALQHMIADGYSEAAITRMRAGLAGEGWLNHPDLPKHWRYKHTSSIVRPVIRIITENGDMFDNFRAAKEYFGDNEADSIKFDRFVKDVAKKFKVKQTPLVPTGWRIENNSEGGDPWIVAQDGTKFSSRLDALKKMVAGVLDKKQMKDMRDCLSHEGWRESPCLPEGWKYKSSGTEVTFLSGEVEVIATVEEAREHLLTHTANKHQYLDNIKKLTNFLADFRTNEHADEVKPTNQSEWKDSENVPIGWKVKISNARHILAPDGRQFKSVKNAIQFMVKQSWRLEDLDCMRSKLVRDGWSLDPRLPEGWAMKSTAKSDSIKYISPSGQDFNSTRAAVKYLKENKGTKSDIKKFQSLLKIKIRV